jgi:hypothetical protein
VSKLIKVVDVQVSKYRKSFGGATTNGIGWDFKEWRRYQKKEILS